MKMHDDEFDIDADLVAGLVASQFPEFAHLPLRAVRSTGTVNAIYRLGDELSVRMPRVARWAGDLTRELAWLPRLAPRLSLAVPEPLGTGMPTGAYPSPWAVYRWIDGGTYADESIDDERAAASDLAQFVTELRRIDPVGAPPAGRKPLRLLDAVTRSMIDAAGDVIDGEAALAAWEFALEAPAFEGPSVWIHTDLLRPNLLVADGRLRAVLDWGGAGVGDPAADVIAAWSLFGAAGRAAFRGALDVDDATWNRARGFALHQATLIIPYYRETNPVFVELARRTVREVLADLVG